jgi:hypothetical protein
MKLEYKCLLDYNWTPVAQKGWFLIFSPNLAPLCRDGSDCSLGQLAFDLGLDEIP